MARILAYTSPARGHLFPVTPILAELARRGHSVAVRTLASQVPLMREQGFDAAPLAPGVEAIEGDDWRARNQREGMLSAVRMFAARAAVDAPDLTAAIERERPDALLVDVNTWGAMSAAERSGLPWAVFCPYPVPLPSPDAPPFGPGLPPPTSPLRRALNAVARPVVMGVYERAFLPPLNEIRAAMGLPALGSAGDLFTRPPLLLHLTAEPFEYPRRDWPASFVLAGPCDWEPPAEPPGWLARAEAPIVLVTTSSEFQDDGRLVRTALEALRDEPFTVVATLPAGDPAGFDPPPNARVERFVPHGAVLDRAVCAVTHGGMGATQKALARGVPVAVVPFGRDQPEVARRVVESGCGTRLPAGRLRPDRLRAAVHEAISRAEGARRVAAAFRAAGGPAAAAGAVEARLLSGRRTP